MALVTCPDCQKKISDLAEFCIGFGRPMKGHRNTLTDRRKAPGANGSNVLSVQLRPQETRMWCWAASAEMIMEFLGSPGISQCSQAQQYLNVTACCVSPTPEACINGGWPQFEYYGFNASNTEDEALSWEQLTREIDANRPVAFGWHWNSGGGHMVVVCGYQEIGGERFVVINDPWPPEIGSGGQLIPYDNYVSPSDGWHWRDYYEIERVVAGVVSTHIPRGVAVPGEGKDAIYASRNAARLSISVILRASGIDRPGSEEESKIESSIPVVHVGLNELLAAAPSGEASILDKPRTQVVHIVTMPDHQMTAIVTHAAPDAPGGWKATSLGNKTLAKLINEARRAHEAYRKIESRGPGALPDYVAVEVPALGLYFLAYKDAEGGKFISVTDDRQLGLIAGKEEPENTIRRIMERLAHQHNKEPG